MKILFIDDDEALGTIFQTALQKAGFEVVLAKDGASGLETAGKENFDLILLDQVLPDISGNEILKKLKENAQTQNIPVIMVSNFSQEELVKEAIAQGAIDYIFKYQIEPQDLVNKIKNTLASNQNNNYNN